MIRGRNQLAEFTLDASEDLVAVATWRHLNEFDYYRNKADYFTLGDLEVSSSHTYRDCLR